MVSARLQCHWGDTMPALPQGQAAPQTGRAPGMGTQLFPGDALSRGSAQPGSSCDKPFLPRINYSYTKVLLIGLEVPENSDSLLFNSALLILSFSPTDKY